MFRPSPACTKEHTPSLFPTENKEHPQGQSQWQAQGTMEVCVCVGEAEGPGGFILSRALGLVCGA